MRATPIERSQARDNLRSILPPETTVYTVLRHVSASGMTRWIDLYIINNDQPRRITYAAATAAGFTYDTTRETLKVRGCGADMGFHVVYTLSRTLYPDGAPVRHAETDGGYALNQRWL